MKIFKTELAAEQALRTSDQQLKCRCDDFRGGVLPYHGQVSDNETLKREIEKHTSQLLSWHRGPNPKRTTVEILEETIKYKTRLMFKAMTEDGLVAGFVRVSDTLGVIEVYPLS